MSTKKPVVVESYDEIVFPEPSEGFLARMQSHPAVTLPRLPPGFTFPPGKFCGSISVCYLCFYLVDWISYLLFADSTS